MASILLKQISGSPEEEAACSRRGLLAGFSGLAAALLGSPSCWSEDPPPERPVELYSAHVRILDAAGPFPRLMIREQPYESARTHAAGRFRIPIPTAFKSSGRETVFVPAGGQGADRTLLRIDEVARPAGEKGETSRAFLRGYLAALESKSGLDEFVISDRGLIELKGGGRFAMAAGAYRTQAGSMFRLQAISRDGPADLYLTFDCPDEYWARYERELARVLISIRRARA